MDITLAKLIYFSPTRTTKKVAEAIADGLHIPAVEHVDLTMRKQHPTPLGEVRDALAVIAAPVYGGRLPLEMIARLKGLTGVGAPAVLVVVYGNRAYEDALLELHDLARAAGFRPVAAGAFIGEHSLSTGAAPLAVGRPDQDDVGKAEAFGRMVRAKLDGLREFRDIAPLKVPGNYPYKERKASPKVAPATKADLCTTCGECATVCPTAAITVGESVTTVADDCIRCCACVRACPTGARVADDPRITQVADWLYTNFKERREPETYL